MRAGNRWATRRGRGEKKACRSTGRMPNDSCRWHMHMQRAVAALFLILSLSHLEVAKGQDRTRLVLPNPKLLRCSSSDCAQLWSETAGQRAIFPKQLIFDADEGCIYGVTALYDKSVSVDQV